MTATTKFPVVTMPSDTEFGEIEVAYDLDRLSITQLTPVEGEEPFEECVVLAMDRVPDLMIALADAQMAKKRANSTLYRDPSTVTKGDA